MIDEMHEDTSFTIRISQRVQPPPPGYSVLGRFKHYRWDVTCYRSSVHQWHRSGYTFTLRGAARQAGVEVGRHSDT